MSSREVLYDEKEEIRNCVRNVCKNRNSRTFSADVAASCARVNLKKSYKKGMLGSLAVSV